LSGFLLLFGQESGQIFSGLKFERILITKIQLFGYQLF
jgi:hypothetical protein